MAAEHPRLDSLLESGDAEGALAYVLALGPASQPSLEALHRLLDVALGKQQRAVAAEVLQLIRRGGPSPAQLLSNALLLARHNWHAEAMELFEALPPPDSQRFGVLEQKARSLEALGKEVEARATWELTTKLYPTSAKAWQMLARFHRHAQDQENEARSLFELLKFRLKDRAILARLAVLYARLGRHRESLDLWTQLARADPANANAHFGILQQMIRLKRFGAAGQWLAENRSRLPETDETARMIAIVDDSLAKNESAA